MNLPDTNQIAEAGQAMNAIKDQVQINWTAICFAVALFSRELRNFNAWCRNILEWIIGHGGLGWLLWKLIWNPPSQTAKAGPAPVVTTNTPKVAEQTAGAAAPNIS